MNEGLERQKRNWNVINDRMYIFGWTIPLNIKQCCAFITFYK